jgi:hypothetical protein
VGVIDSLSTGFETVASHIGLTFIPALLDVFLWLGPRLSVYPITQNLIQQVGQTPASTGVCQQGGLPLIALLRLLGERNIFRGLSTAPLGVPVLTGGYPLNSAPVGQPLVLGINNELVLLTLLLTFAILGLLLGAIYFVLIGALVDQGASPSWQEVVRRVFVNWTRLTALAVIVSCFAFLVGLMAVLLLAILQLGLLAMGTMLALAFDYCQVALIVSQIVAAVLILWIAFVLAFSIHGMVLKNRGVLGSMWDSVRLVHWNLLSVTGLFVLICLISIGLTYLWTLPAPDSWLTLAGIAGHAFVSTGLVAATFVFYKDRYRWWTEMRQWLLAEQRRFSNGRR